MRAADAAYVMLFLAALLGALGVAEQLVIRAQRFHQRGMERVRRYDRGT